MLSSISAFFKHTSSQPQIYEMGLGVFVICFVLTSLLFWQTARPVVIQTPPTYYTLQDDGQITPVAATVDLTPETEVMGESIQR